MNKVFPVKSLLVLITCLLIAASAIANTPSHSNIRYSEDFERSLLDLWLPDAENAAPVIIFFHGGGFKQGSKNWFPMRKEFLALTQQGIAVASVGYPLLGDQGKSSSIGPADYDKILTHTERAIAFLREHSTEYKLDASRMVVAGSSAGAMISQHLTYAADFDISACIAIQQPYAVQRVMEVIDSGEPPLILYTTSGPNDQIHHPRYAQAVHHHCQALGVTSHLYGSQKNDLPKLPDGKTFVTEATRILTQLWASPE
ncbi:MAG: alpha/beta hydrolase [Gammaproteobacteria bacterium]|nr:alpha/beta hydrolase [Gammaproteobacteria bacterium]